MPQALVAQLCAVGSERFELRERRQMWERLVIQPFATAVEREADEVGKLAEARCNLASPNFEQSVSVSCFTTPSFFTSLAPMLRAWRRRFARRRWPGSGQQQSREQARETSKEGRWHRIDPRTWFLEGSGVLRIRSGRSPNQLKRLLLREAVERTQAPDHI